MTVLAVLLLVYFVIGAGVCLLVCVNPNDPGILGRMSKFFLGTLPGKVGAIIRRVFGERVYSWFGKAKHYMMETNHPIVQVFYLLIAPGGFVAYEVKGVIKFMPNRYVGNFQVVFATLLGLFCFWIYYKACAVSPGRVSKNNEQFYNKKYEQYLDGILYTPKKKCETCKTSKPPRSKHCRVCDVCWAKFDHHCIWIRQCVGEKNYKWFLMFLLFHAILCLYYALIGTLSIYAHIQDSKLLESQFYMGEGYVQANWMLVITYLFMTETLFLFLIVMCAIMGTTLLLFSLYHFYLVDKNMTSNQRVKTNDYIAELKLIIRGQAELLEEYKGWENMPSDIEYYKRKYKKEDLQKLFKQNEDDLVKLSSKWPTKGFIGNMKVIFSQ